MADDDMPWEPPAAGDELAHLTAAVDRMRTTFRWKADGLDAAGLAQRVAPSQLSLGGLLKHLAAVEDLTFTWKLHGTHPGQQWDFQSWGDNGTEILAAGDDSPETLYATWDDAVARSRERLDAVLADGGLDTVASLGDERGHLSLRRLLFDLLEEYGRHTGHADLLREAVDGRVGEDPPQGWVPESGAPLAWIRNR
ncbi:DUF664 domain-containing protein [Cellulomonas marina]|uniref:DinB superfamily protein n=1 Tax=Cellulomonas marina TaxID=988821 RepID=A0A1I1AZB4_9CELL|nr:DUF664 domain-containing protein [Cellulomonas marina]GIG30766.1 mini-circle protein [Cellulomonas marina]SFB41603.1 Protein of unknown function [Cellulomonas marina]